MGPLPPARSHELASRWKVELMVERAVRPSSHEVAVAGAVKRFGGSVALGGVDLRIGAGRFVVLLGPSGSGKSTLARCLAGVERLDGGSIHLGGQLVGDHRCHLPPERRNLAMVFQDYALWPHMTASANVAFALRRLRIPAGESKKRIGEALARVGLGDLAARYPHELSGGEQQRVALARALVARPALLLFDEPLSNLDADLRERLRVGIATLTRESGATAVYITHDQSEAFALADEIAVLDKGRLVQYARPEEVYRRPASPFVARFTGVSGELVGELAGVGGGPRGELEVRVAGGVVRCAVAAGAVAAGAVAAGAVAAGADAAGGAPDPVALAQGRVRVLIRPAATGLLAAALRPDGSLLGRVVDVAYRGRGYDHVVECGAGTLTAVFDARRWDRGTPVTVTLDPLGCIAYPDETAVPQGRYEPELTSV
jgi:iron(III) transport system ATP-binding protein